MSVTGQKFIITNPSMSRLMQLAFDLLETKKQVVPAIPVDVSDATSSIRNEVHEATLSLLRNLVSPLFRTVCRLRY